MATEYVVYVGTRKRKAGHPVRVVGADGTAIHIFDDASAPSADLPRLSFQDALADALRRANLPTV